MIIDYTRPRLLSCHSGLLAPLGDRIHEFASELLRYPIVCSLVIILELGLGLVININ